VLPGFLGLGPRCELTAHPWNFLEVRFSPEEGVPLMKALGCHIILELSQCNSEVLRSLSKVKGHMVEAARRAKAQVRKVAFHKFSPQGISGVVVIAESHLSIHTWPEFGYAAVDIYTCGPTTDPQKACDYLAEALEAKQVARSVVERGIESPVGSYSHSIASSQDTLSSSLIPVGRVPERI